MESHRFNPCNQIATPKLIMDKFFNSFPIASNQLERRTNCQSLKEELVRMRIEYLWKETVGFVVEDNDMSVEANMDVRLSHVEKEVRDLRGDLNNLVVGVSQ
ncbi:hypothetical protein CsSME_00008759 [Camellia sinensis var. sinensis]